MNQVVCMPVDLVTGPDRAWYAELTSALSGDCNHVNTHYTYPARDDQAELAWVTWLTLKMVCYQWPHLSTNIQNPLHTFPRNFRVDRDAAKLLRTC